MRLFLFAIFLSLICFPSVVLGFNEAPSPVPAPAPLQNFDNILKEASLLFRTLSPNINNPQDTLQKTELSMDKHCLDIIFDFESDLISITCRTTDYIIEQLHKHIAKKKWLGGGVGTGTTYYCTPDRGLEVAVATDYWTYFKIHRQCDRNALHNIKKKYDFFNNP